jgi:hypothetical protein
VSFWGCAFTLITLAIALFKEERDHYSEQREKREWRSKHHRSTRSSSSSSSAAAAAGGPDAPAAATQQEAGTAGLRQTRKAAAAAAAAAAADSNGSNGSNGCGPSAAAAAAAAAAAVPAAPKSEWATRKSEIVTAYLQLWGVVSWALLLCVGEGVARTCCASRQPHQAVHAHVAPSNTPTRTCCTNAHATTMRRCAFPPSGRCPSCW